MSAFMLLAKQLGLMGEQPPRKITRRFLVRSGDKRPRGETQDVLASALHFGFGAAGGTLFALAFRLLRLPFPSALQGAAYGTGVWAVSYLGWVPELGIMPPADRDRPGRPQSMLIAHWIYGSVLGVLVSGHRAVEE